MRMHKQMVNLEIAELLRDIAACYELKNADLPAQAGKYKFQIIAYQRAADAVEHASSELKDLWDDGKLEDVPGIGKSIAEHLDELFRTGRSEHFDRLKKGLPSQIFSLMELPGIGVKTASRLVSQLGLEKSKDPVSALEKLAKQGKIARLEGFGDQSQADILRAIEEDRRRVKRYLLPYALNIAEEIIAYMRKEKTVIRADALGSLRRLASTVGDIDIAVVSKAPQDVLKHFTGYPKKVRVLEQGEKTASILLPGNVQVDVMVQKPEAYGSLLQHFTGSKHHNIALREYALKRGLSLSEYGIKELKAPPAERAGKSGKLKAYSSEKEFYGVLGLAWITPELREDMGEIEAALRSALGKQDGLPELVRIEDIKADLQIHSSFDIETSHDLGESSMEEIVEAADKLGYEYLAFSEHNPRRSRHADSQILDILKRKKEAVEQINYSLVKSMNKRVKKVFNGLEIDILPDGRLPVPEQGLALLDFALISIHSSFRLSRDEMTKRVLTGLSHPRVKILAHPTARKLNEREGVELDWPRIFDFCLKHDKWLEINADPMRLDLPDMLVKEAVKNGVKLTLGTDAHHKDGLYNMLYGVSVARRGWAEKKNIINTLGVEEFEKMVE